MSDLSPSHHLVAVSIISHCHGVMVQRLAQSLLTFPEVGQLMVTSNIPENLCLPPDPRIIRVTNNSPQGFAANHNKTFQQCHFPYFCVLNPDMEIPVNPFPPLLDALRRTNASIVAPRVTNASGAWEDSIRTFPTLRTLFLKALGLSDGRHRVHDQTNLFYPEWVAGMFMLFSHPAFAQLKGFDPRYFLYYEDVDICVRAWKNGMKVLVCPQVAVIHHAQRASHRNFRYFCWHLSSMIRYFGKHWGRLPSVQSKR